MRSIDSTCKVPSRTIQLAKSGFRSRAPVLAPILFAWLAGWAWAQPTPVAHWPLDEGSGGNVADLSQNYPGTVSGATWVSGWQGGALRFDGDDRISFDGPGFTGNQITIALWFLVEDFDVSDARLISRASGTAEGDHDWMLSTVSSNGAMRLRARLRTNGSTKTLIANSGSIQTGVWTHAALVYDGASLRLYQDGVQVGSHSQNGNLSERAGLGVAVGNQPAGAGDRGFDGIVDDIRLYGSALDETELAAITTTCPGQPTAAFSAVPDGIAAPVTVALDASLSSDCDGTLTDAAWDFGDGTTGSGFSTDHVFTEPGSYDITLTVTDNDGLTGTAVRTITVLDEDERLTDRLLAAYHFTEANGAMILDVSGVVPALDLAIENPSATSWDPCGGLTVNGATLIRSTGSAAKISDAVRASNAITVEAWLEPASDNQTGPARIVTLSDGAFDRNITLGQEGSAYLVRLRTTETDDNGTNPHTQTGSGVAVSNLSHVVYTRDPDGKAILYVNGQVAATRTVAGDTDNWSSDFELGLANEIGADRPWLGTFHMVAVYDAALSPEVIAHHRDVGPPVSCNRQPVARIEADEITGQAPLTVTFDAGLSHDPDGVIATYDWDFGNGQTGSGPNAQHVFSTPGTYGVSLTVTDDGGESASRTLRIEVAETGAPYRTGNGLRAFYRFEENGGALVADHSGSGFPLDLTIDEPANSTWLACRGLSLDSDTLLASRELASKIVQAVKTTGAISVEAWVKPDNLAQGPSSPARIVTISESPTSRNLALGQQQTEYDVRLRTTTNNGTQPSTATTGNAATTALVHVIYTRDSNGEARIFVDNQLRGQQTVDGELSAWDDNFFLALGNELTRDRAWLGDLYLVALYDRALDESEIAQNFSAGVSGLCLDLAITEPADDTLTNGDSIAVSGTLSHPGATVTVNGVDATVEGLSWNALLPLDQDGTIAVTAVAHLGGHTATAGITIERDTAGPVIVLNAPPTVNQLENLAYDWQVSDVHGLDTVQVSLNGQPAGTGASGNQIYAVPEDPNLTEIELRVTATDSLGNASQAVVQVEVLPPCNGQPEAAFALYAGQPVPPTTVAVDAAPSFDCDGSIADYQWDFGDGATAEGQVAQHVYTAPGSYQITLTVTDNDGQTATAVHTVAVAEPPIRVRDHLLAEYLFTEATGTTIHDSSDVSPALDLEIADPAAVAWPACGGLQVNQATLIGATATPSKLSDSIKASNALTIEAWITPANDSQNGPARIVTLSDGAFDRNFTLGQEASQYVVRLRTTVTGNNGSSPAIETATGAVTPTMTHVLYTRDADGAATIYVDGQVAATRAIGGNLSNWADEFSFALANEIGGDRAWLGTYHLVAVYDTALTPEQVDQNYRAGPGSPCNQPPVAQIQTETLSGEAPFSVSLNGVGSFDPDGVVSDYAWSFGDGTAAQGILASHLFTEPGAYTVTLTVTDDDGASDNRDLEIRVVAPGQPYRTSEGLAVLYDFRSGSGVLVPDRSGVGSPLDLTIGDGNRVTWLDCGGLRFDDDTIALSATPAGKVIESVKNNGGAITIEAWVTSSNLTQGPVSPARIVTVSDTPTTRNATLGQKAGEYDVRFRTTDTNDNGDNPSTATAGDAVSLSLSHVVYVREASGLTRIYVDGSPRAEETVSGTAANWDDAYFLALGNEIDPMERSWLGTYHLVAVYGRALDPSEIADHYAAGTLAICPNHPPVFTTEPVTVAETGLAYAYDADAVDPDGDTVGYSLPEAPTGMSIDPGTGLVSWTPASNQAGDHPVRILAIDGNGGAADQAFVVTVAGPQIAIAITAPEEGLLTNADIVTVTGTVTDATATVEVNGVAATLTGLDWSVDVPLTGEGLISLVATATLGSAQAVASRTIERDITPPVIVLDAADTVTQGDTLDFSWTVTDANPIVLTEVRRDTDLVSTEGNGSASYEVPIETGLTEILLSVHAEDAAGNPADLSRTVAVTPLALTVTILDPLDGALTAADSIEVSGTVMPAETPVTVNGEPATVTSNDWSATISLQDEGTVLLTARASLGDLEALDNVEIERDTTGPDIAFNAPDSVLEGESFDFDWNVTDLHGPVTAQVERDGETVGDSASGSGSFDVALGALNPIVFQIDAQDVLGNESSLSHTVQVQPLALQLAIDTPAEGFLTNLDLVTVTGTVSDPGSAVTVNGVAATLTGTVWSAEVPLTVEGPVALTAEAVLGPYTATAMRTIHRDVTPPALGIDAPANALEGTAFDFEWSATDENGIANAELTRDGDAVSTEAAGMASYAIPALAGLTEVVFHLTATDGAGNTADTSLTVTVDPLDLGLTVTGANADSPDDGAWTNGTRQDYNLAAGVHVERVEVTSPSLAGPEEITLTDAAGTWFVENLAEGVHDFTFTWYGPTETSGSVQLQLRIDRTPPTFDWTPPAEADFAAAIAFTATLTDALSEVDSGRIADLTSPAGTNPDVVYQKVPDLAWTWTSPAEGTLWEIQVTANDIAGNLFDRTYTIFLGMDPTLDEFEIAWDAPGSGFVTRDQNLAIQGRILLGQAQRISVNGTDAAIEHPNFSLTLPLPDEGLVWLNLEAIGARGQERRYRRQVIVDRTPPDIVLEGGTDQSATGDRLDLRGTLFDRWDPRPNLSVAGRPELGNFESPFSISQLPPELFPLTLTAVDHVGNASDTVVTWNPDPGKGIEVSLTATPNAAFTGDTFILTAQANALGASPVRDVAIFSLDSGQPVHLAVANEPVLRHPVPVPDRSSQSVMRFRTVARAFDGSSDEATVEVPIMGDVLIEGSVFDAATGHPIDGAGVAIAPSGQSLNTDGTGAYRLWFDRFVSHLTVSAPGYTSVQIQGPFLPGDVGRLPDARLTPLGGNLGSGAQQSLEPAEVLAAAANPAIAAKSAAAIPDRTNLAWNGGSVALTQLADQALPMALPLGWWPHTVFQLGNGTGSGTWTGPGRQGSLLVSFAKGEPGWTVEAPATASWNLGVQPGRGFAWVVPDVPTAPQTAGNLLQILPEIDEAPVLSEANLRLSTDPPVSLARPGIASLAIVDNMGGFFWSGQRAEMVRQEAYEQLNPGQADTVEQILLQQVVLYRGAEGSGTGYLPLVPRRDALLPTVRLATIGGPAQPVSRNPGTWVGENGYREEIAAGWFLEAQGSDRFWLRIEESAPGFETLFDWRALNGFRLSLEDRGANPQISLRHELFNAGDAGKIALFQELPNTLGASYRVVGVLNGSGNLELLAGRSWTEGRYFLVRAPVPFVIGSVSLNPANSGAVRALDTPLGDIAPGWLALGPGRFFIRGRADNLAEGVREQRVIGNESGLQSWVVQTGTPALTLARSLPEHGDSIDLTPQFLLEFSHGVERTSVTPASLAVTVNGATRVMNWQWEAGNFRALGKLAHLIEDEQNDVLQPGDTLAIAGTNAIVGENGLVMTPFSLSFQVPAATQPLPLAPENLFMTYNPDRGSAVIQARAPIGPIGTAATFFNPQTTSSGFFIQIANTAAMRLEIMAEVGDTIEATLLGPGGAVVRTTLSLYHAEPPTENRVAVLVGPMGGKILLPGAGTLSVPPGAVNDLTQISMERWLGSEPDFDIGANVSVDYWIADGLETEDGGLALTWTPELTFDAEGNPTTVQQLSQAVPYLPEFVREQLDAAGSDVPDRALVELGNPIQQQRLENVTINPIVQDRLGAPPSPGEPGHGPGWAFGNQLDGGRMAMIVTTMPAANLGTLPTKTAAKNDSATLKFGEVGVFDYKQTVLDGIGTLSARDGDLLAGAWILGTLSSSPSARYHPIKVTITDRNGYYGTHSGWYAQGIGQGEPFAASHPAFTDLARRILIQQRFLQTPPVVGGFLASRTLRSDFGFWLVDPEGGIGTARPEGFRLSLVERKAIGFDGEEAEDQTRSLNEGGALDTGFDIQLFWRIDEEIDIRHVAMTDLGNQQLNNEVLLAGEEGNPFDFKVVALRIPSQPVGTHQVALRVRNELGFELTDRFSWRALPVGSTPIDPDPLEGAPYILELAVRPVPLDEETLNDPGAMAETESDIGSFNDGELLFLPFSEPVTTGPATFLRDQIAVELMREEPGAEWNSWPVDFLHPETLAQLEDSEQVDSIYVRPLGNFPGQALMRVTVFTGGSIKDVGTETPELGLADNEDFPAGIHYRAYYRTKPEGFELSPFSQNAVFDYATHGKFLFELSWNDEDGGPEVVVYEIGDNRVLKEFKRFPVREVTQPGYSPINVGARVIEFWPTEKAYVDLPPDATDEERAQQVPGYILVGYTTNVKHFGSQSIVIRPARMKFFNANKQEENKLVGGYATGDTSGDRVKHISVADGLAWLSTNWGGIFAVDMEALREYYEEGGIDSWSGGPDKPPYSTVTGVNQPSQALKERYFPLRYPPEFVLGPVISSPVQSHIGKVRKQPDKPALESVLWGTGGIEFGAWFLGNPPVEFLLSGFDAGYAPFDPFGEQRYDVIAKRLSQWDEDDDRVDDRRIYNSGEDPVWQSQSIPLLGKGAVDTDENGQTKFRPIYLEILPQFQTDLMEHPLDIAVMRTNPSGSSHGGLMFAGLKSRTSVEYYAFLRFDSKIANIAVNKKRGQVAAISENGRLIVIDVATWIDLGIQFKDEPFRQDLAALNETISDPAQPIRSGQFLPGLLVDVVAPDTNHPLAFMDDRIMVGSDRAQYEVVLERPLFINPGFYEDDDVGGRSRFAEVQVIPSSDDNGYEVKLDLEWELSEDARVSLVAFDDEGNEDRLWDSPNVLKSEKGARTHRLTFPLSKLGLSESDVARERIPMAVLRKLRLEGTPDRAGAEEERVRLSLELQSDPWGIGPPHLDATGGVEPWSGRAAFAHNEIPALPSPGISLDLTRQYVSQGLWDGVSGRGFSMPFEAKIVWLVKEFGATERAWMNIRLPNSEVVPAFREGSGAWQFADPRFQENPNFEITSETGPDDDERGGFPETVKLMWGTLEMEFEYRRHMGSGDFSQAMDDIEYSANNNLTVPPTSDVRQGLFAMTRWEAKVGEGGSTAGWEFTYRGDRVHRAESTTGGHLLEMEYDRHATGKLALSKIEISSEHLEGKFSVSFFQDPDEEDFLLLSRVDSDIQSYGSTEYAYKDLAIGFLLGAGLQVDTRVVESISHPTGGETTFSWLLRSGDPLPPGISWPYVFSVDNEGYTHDRWTFTWQEFLPGRSVTADLAETFNSTAEDYSWQYNGEGMPASLTRNGVVSTQDWSAWPDSVSTTMPIGIEVTNEFDDLHRLTRTRVDSGDPVNEPQYEYVGQTNLISRITHSDGRVETFTYDGLGRLKTRHDGMGLKAKVLSYHLFTTLPSTTEGDTGITAYHDFDVLGRPTRLQRSDYTREMEYFGNGVKVDVAGDWGLGYTERMDLSVVANGTVLTHDRVPADGITPPVTLRHENTFFGLLNKITRNGTPIYEATEHGLGGPRREILHWYLNGAVKVMAYEKTQEGYLPVRTDLNDVTVWSAEVDGFGRYTTTRDHTKGLVETATFNSLGQVTSLTKGDYLLGEIGKVQERVSITYESLTSQRIERNQDVYTVQLIPGETWIRTIAGPAVDITESGSGMRFHQTEGRIRGARLWRNVTTTGTKQIIDQSALPHRVVKSITGDGRVYAIASGAQNLWQEFTGFGEVLRTTSAGSFLYELQAINEHGQRTAWESRGVSHGASYRGALLETQRVGDELVYSASAWDYLGRARAFKVRGTNFSAQYAGEEDRFERIENLATQALTFKFMDGLGRVVEKNLFQPNQTRFNPVLKWFYRYGRGVDDFTSPGDRLIGYDDVLTSRDYRYTPEGLLVFQGQRVNPDFQKMEDPPEERLTTYEHDTEGDPENPVKVETTFGPEGYTAVRKINANGDLIELRENGLLVLAREYDERSRLVRGTDHQGAVTTYAYEGERRVPASKTTLAGDERRIDLYQYDNEDRLTLWRTRVRLDENGEYQGGVFWKYTYDSFGRKKETMRADESQQFRLWERLTYDGAGRVATRLDAAGVTWTMGYDPILGEIGSRTNDADATEETWTYQEEGRVVTYRRGEDYTVATRRDIHGRITEQRVNGDKVWSYVYDPRFPMPVEETHPDGREVERLFDEYGNPINIVYSDGTDQITVEQEFDLLDRLTGVVTSSGQQAQFSYDPRGFLASESWRLINHPDPLTTTYDYDDRGNQIGVTFPSGRRLGRGFDSAGRLRALYEAGSQQASFDYDLFGQLSRVTQDGSVADFEYDDFGRLTGHLLQIAEGTDNASVRQERFAYSGESGHPDNITHHELVWGEANLAEDYFYHPLGMLETQRILSAENIPGLTPGDLVYHYGPMLRPETIETPFGTSTFTYNDDGSTRSRSFREHTTVYDYDQAGRLLTETEYDTQSAPTGYQRQFAYDAMGLLKNIVERGPPAREHLQSFEYDSFGRMRAQKNESAGNLDWNVYTLSAPLSGSEAPLPIPLVGGTRTLEVLLTSSHTRGGSQTLGYAYGPAGLSHVTAFPTDNYTRGSISQQLTDPFQSTVAMLAPRAMDAAPGVSGLAMGTFWDPWGNGIALDPSLLFTPEAVPDSAMQTTGVLGNVWSVLPEETGSPGAANEANPVSGDIWANRALFSLIPGFTGKTVTGGYLDHDSDPEGQRLAENGMADTPISAMHHLDTRFYQPATRGFTAPDQWAMFQTVRDHFTANRYLYANADPVGYWDPDGRLASLKRAMDYTSLYGDIEDINYWQMQNIDPWAGFKAAADPFLDGLQLSLAVVSLGGDLLSLAPVPGFRAFKLLALTADGLDLAISISRGDSVGMALGGMAAIGSLAGLPGSSIGKFARTVKAVQAAQDARRLDAVVAAMGLAQVSARVIAGGGDLESVIQEGFGVSSTVLEAQNMLRTQGLCFAPDTDVLTVEGMSPIQSVSVGDRVVTHEPDAPPEAEIDPDEWVLVTMVLSAEATGDEAVEIQTIRPESWRLRMRVEPGQWIYLALEEIALQGPALITAVTECPPIREGEGRVVLSTIRTVSRDLLEFRFREEAVPPLRLTGSHLLYSLDREDWVRAAEVDIGEAVMSRGGAVHLAAREELPAPQTVYNLEVEGAHNYFVEDEQILGHNLTWKAWRNFWWKGPGRATGPGRKFLRIAWEDRSSFNQSKEFFKRYRWLFGANTGADRWSMEHMIIKQRWYRGVNPWFEQGTVGNKILQGLGDSGLNVVPIPQRFNKWLDTHRAVSGFFNYGTYAAIGAGSYYGVNYFVDMWNEKMHGKREGRGRIEP